MGTIYEDDILPFSPISSTSLNRHSLVCTPQSHICSIFLEPGADYSSSPPPPTPPPISDMDFSCLKISQLVRQNNRITSRRLKRQSFFILFAPSIQMKLQRDTPKVYAHICIKEEPAKCLVVR